MFFIMEKNCLILYEVRNSINLGLIAEIINENKFSVYNKKVFRGKNKTIIEEITKTNILTIIEADKILEIEEEYPEFFL